MTAIKDEAIVLRRLDYSETSQVLAFFTRDHGPRRLIAKGVKRSTKKKFATGIDLTKHTQQMTIANGRLYLRGKKYLACYDLIRGTGPTGRQAGL